MTLMRGNKRTVEACHRLGVAIQAFNDNTLTGVIVGKAETPEHVLMLLSMPLASIMPKDVMRRINAVYVGELFAPYVYWGGARTAERIADHLRQLGIPLKLDLDEIGWIPPYMDDANVQAALSLRWHDVDTVETCVGAEHDGCISVGEVFWRCAERWKRMRGRPKADYGPEMKKGTVLRSTMFVPRSWTPPARDPEGCRRFAGLEEWGAVLIPISTKASFEEAGYANLAELAGDPSYANKLDPDAADYAMWLLERWEVICRLMRGDRSDELKELVRILDQPCEGLELSVRTANILKNAGCETMRDVVMLTEDGFLRLPNSGRKCLSELKSLLAYESRHGSYQLHLGMTFED
jgi:hypothetical protein